MFRSHLLLLVLGLALLVVTACSQQPTEDELRAIVRSEITAVIAEVKQGPPGEQGPLPSNELLTGLIEEVILELKEDLRGPQGLRGEQGPQGARGPQGVPGTAQLSQGDRMTLSNVVYLQNDLANFESRITSLQNDLANLRRNVECEVSSGFSFCSSSLSGLMGGTLGSRVTSLQNDIANLQSEMSRLWNDAHRHTIR